MSSNKFLPFANGGNANVLSDADYGNALNSYLNGGFRQGIAYSNQINKVLRQTTTMCSALGAVILSRTKGDVTDSESVGELAQRLQESFDTLISQAPGNQVVKNSDGIFVPPVNIPKVTINPPQSDFYVNSANGNDANNGFTPATAFQTLQGAINVITDRYPLGGTITLHVSDGQYGGFTINESHFLIWNIQGNNADPSKVVIGDVAENKQACVIAGKVTAYISGVSFKSAADNVVATNASKLFLSNFQCNAPTWEVSIISAFYNSLLFITGAITFQPGSYYTCIQSCTGSQIIIGSGSADNKTSFAFNNVNANNAVIIAEQSAVITFQNTTFSGNTTGLRFMLRKNGLIDTYGQPETYIPGDREGTITTGGIYT